jgi:flavin-dependent dehydrogenase
MYDVAIIGGGPAGAAAARLLALWGHSVAVLHKPPDRSRGLAESIPPSTRKLLATIDVLDSVERAGFYETTGNTVWWGTPSARIEPFDAGQTGLQVFRPDFDVLLLDLAQRAGATVRRDALVRAVDLDDESGVRVDAEVDGTSEAVCCRFVLDCSGRSGVLAKPFRRVEPAYRMYAIVGEWQKAGGWGLADDTHTLVETYEDGWIWSVPLSPHTRHAGVMIDGSTPRVTSGRGLTEAYRAEVAKPRRISGVFVDADLRRVWACDAALYRSDSYAGSRFFLVGDAGSFIDPLSSFGIKKALASAWMASVAVHTCLEHPGRQAIAIDYFSRREGEMFNAHLKRSRDFAAEAHERHPHAFWARRAEADVQPAVEPAEAELLNEPAVRASLDALRSSSVIGLRMDDGVRVEPEAVIRGREIVLEDAFVGTPRIRFLANVDLLLLAEIACRSSQVPDVYEAYCRVAGQIPLPNVLGALSFLVAHKILTTV